MRIKFYGRFRPTSIIYFFFGTRMPKIVEIRVHKSAPLVSIDRATNLLLIISWKYFRIFFSLSHRFVCSAICVVIVVRFLCATKEPTAETLRAGQRVSFFPSSKLSFAEILKIIIGTEYKNSLCA